MINKKFKVGDEVSIIGSINTTSKSVFREDLTEVEKERIFLVIKIEDNGKICHIKSLKTLKVKTIPREYLIKIKQKIKLNLDIVF